MAPTSAGNETLVQAIKADNASAVEALIGNATEELRSDLLAQGLTAACEQRQLACINQLLALGADPNERYGSRLPPLIIAVKHDHLEIVKVLLRYSQNNNDELLKRKTIRSCLARARSRAVAELLIDHGADIESMDKEGKEPLIDTNCPPPLQLAAKFDLLEIVRRLLANDLQDGRPQLSSKTLRTALNFAQSRDVAQELIIRGADITSRGKGGKTLLMEKISCYPVAQLLIDHRVPLNDRDNEGKTALMTTLMQDNDPTMANYILSKGGRDIMEAADLRHRTVLMYAVWKSRVEIVRRLVERLHVDVNALDHRERNVLHHMAQDERRVYQYQPEARTGDNETQQDRDKVMLDILFRTSINHEAQDSQSRTCVHSAAANGCAGLLRLFLRRGKFDLNRTAMRRKTALHLAADHGHVEVIDVLLEKGADVNAESDGDWTPLHNACWHTADRTDVVKLLLSNGADLNKENKTGRTPLHIAAMAGNLSVVRLLLEQEGIDRNATDAFGNTPLLCAAMVQHKSRSDIVNLFAPWRKRNIDTLPEERREAMQQFQATIVDFGDKFDAEEYNWTGNSVQSPTVFDLIYGRKESVDTTTSEAQVRRESKDSGKPKQAKELEERLERKDTKTSEADKGGRSNKDLKPGRTSKDGRASNEGDRSTVQSHEPTPRDNASPAIPVTSADAGENGFRWIHFPANNMTWCQELFTKYFVEQGALDVDSLKALERSFNHQHRGHAPQSRYMTPVCQTVIRSWSSAEGGYTEEDELEGPPSRKSTMDEPIDAYVQRTTSPPRNASPPRPTSPQIQHVSFPGSVPEGSTTRESAAKKPKRTNTLASREKAIEKGGRKPPYIQPRPTKKSDDGSISDFYVFMPYIHFETYQEMVEMTSNYDRSGKTTSSNATPAPVAPRRSQQASTAGTAFWIRRQEEQEALKRELALFRAYLNDSEQTLHIRRTLDQSFYHHVDTSHRDTDQVIHRFQKHIHRREDLNVKLLMVDQLWMWVIGNRLVVTSFPQRWRQPRKDPLNVLESILAILNAGSRERVKTVQELALIILGRCYGAYDRHGVGSNDPQYLDMFEGWIGAVMDDEVKLFQLFTEDSKDAAAWIRNPSPLRSVRGNKQKASKPFADKEPKKRRVNPVTGLPIEFSVLRELDGSRFPTSESDFIQNLLDVGRETRLLVEIKDIQDELAMLSLVFEQQEMVLTGVRAAMEAMVKQNLSGHDKRTTVVERKLQKALEDHHKTIFHPQRDIERMEKQAKRIYNSIRDLLDLKQKHANAIEARYAGHRTDDTSRQGRTLMVFTIVTVVFLPLSFMTAFFAIEIEGLPRRGNSQVLPLGFVLKYTLGIGLSFAIVFVVIALYPYYSVYLAKDDKEAESLRNWRELRQFQSFGTEPVKEVASSSSNSVHFRRPVSANKENLLERGEGRDSRVRQGSTT